MNTISSVCDTRCTKTLLLDLPHCLVLLRSALADNVYMSRLGRAIANTKNLKLSDINRHGEFIVDSTGQADPEQPHVACLILGLNNRQKVSKSGY